MKILFDFFPIILFFVVYKLYGDLPPEVVAMANTLPLLALTPGEPTDAIYLATAVAILASVLQVGGYWLRQRQVERMHLVSLALLVVFGGLTLMLQDALFIKWKPTILNWLFGIVFLGSRFIGSRTLVERMMGHAVQVPAFVWQRLNLAWVGFFLVAGTTNLLVAYTFDEAVWVDFKLFGLLGMTLAFVFAQAIYLARHMPTETAREKS